MPPKIAPCPECQAQVVFCDNGTRLDYPAVPSHTLAEWDRWKIMPFGHMFFAGMGCADTLLSHALHAHQPPEDD